MPADPLPDPQRDKQKDGPIHRLAEGRYFATVDPDGVPRIYRADTAGAVLDVETKRHWAFGKLWPEGIRICKCGEITLEDEMHACPLPDATSEKTA